MKKKKIFCALLVCVLIVTQIASLGAVSYADGPVSGGDDFEVTLINGAVLRTDDFLDAVEVFNDFGKTLKMNADSQLEESVHITSTGVIDLNGHTLYVREMIIYEKTLTVTDSSESKDGAIEAGIITVLGSAVFEGVELDGRIVFHSGANVVINAVSGGYLELALHGENAALNVENSAFDSVNIEYSEDVSVRMNGLTVRERLQTDGIDLGGFFSSPCISVRSGSGQEIVFEEDVYIYDGALQITHDDSRIDKSAWKHTNLGHFHLCECGYEFDFGEHTSENEKCSVCNAEPYISVTKNGETAYYFDLWKMVEALGDEEQSTVRLHADIFSYDYLDVFGDSSVTLDLGGYELRCYMVYIDGNAELTVTDTSAEKNGRLTVDNYITLEDGGIFRLIDGGLNGDLYIIDESMAVLSGGSSGSIDASVSDQGKLIIDGGSYESIYLNAAPESVSVVNAVVTDSFRVTVDTLGGYLDHSCISVNTGNGPEYDPNSDSYLCEGNSLVITHNDAGISQYGSNGGYHGRVCSACGYLKEIARHSGGSATCSAPASCQVCLSPYGETAPHAMGDNGKCAACPADAAIVVSGDGKTLYFFDLNDAFEAAGELASAVITLRDDVRYDDEVNAYGNIALDMAGYQLYVDEINIYGSLVIGNEENGGRFITDSGIDIYENATLTVEGGDFGDEDVNIDVNSNGSKLFINGGSFWELMIYTEDKNSLAVITDIEVDWLYCRIDEGNVVINGGYFGTAPSIYNDDGDCSEEIFDKPCITLYDETGAEITAEDCYNSYGGELRVEHNAQGQSGGYISFGGGHLAACACGMPLGTEILPHEGGEATCTVGKLCVHCGDEYGDNAPHSFAGGRCSVCGGSELFRVDAQDFSQSYCDIEEAFTASAKHQGATVTALDNSAYIGELALEIPASVTLDLAGKTVCLEYFVLDITSLTVKDSSDGKSGAILGYLLDLYGNTALTLEGGSLYNWVYGYDNSSVTVSGGSCFGGIYAYDNGRISVSGGSIGEDSYYSDPIMICVDDNAAVNISGGVFGIAEIDIDDNTVLDLSGGLFKGEALVIEYDENAKASISGGAFENGIILRLDDGVKQLTLSDIVSGAGCMAFLDGSGNKIDMTAQSHEGYIVASNVCSYALKSDGSGHWYECSVCADRKPVEPHADANGDEVCDICSFDLDAGGLGAGAIVGIVLGSVAVAGIGGFAVFWFVIKKKSIADLVAVFKK